MCQCKENDVTSEDSDSSIYCTSCDDAVISA